MKLNAAFEPAEEGGFTVYVPSLPGCISEGNAYQEAVKNIKKTIEPYLKPDEDELFEYRSLRIAEVVV